MMKSFTFNVPIYDFQVTVTTGAENMEEPDDLGGVYSEDDYQSFFEIRMRQTPKAGAAFYDTLAHEVFHVIAIALRYRGIKLHDKTEEAYAYLTGYIHGQIHKRL